MSHYHRVLHHWVRLDHIRRLVDTLLLLLLLLLLIALLIALLILIDKLLKLWLVVVVLMMMVQIRMPHRIIVKRARIVDHRLGRPRMRRINRIIINWLLRHHRVLIHIHQLMSHLHLALRKTVPMIGRDPILSRVLG